MLKIGREGERTLRPADGDNFVLDMPVKHLPHTLNEFGQFIREVDAAVDKRYIARVLPWKMGGKATIVDLLLTQGL